MSFWEDWFRRRRRLPFFEELDEVIEDMLKEAFEDLPKELFKERELSDGSTVRSFGPFVYGYSMTMGPDGKPVVREFGNLKPTMRGISEATEEREPLVDVITGENVIQVFAELPGVDKSDIQLNTSEHSLNIAVDTETRKYYKEVELPEMVDLEGVKAQYRNGVLEVTFNKLERKKPTGRRINIE